jgi:hypothetical protein
VTYRDELEAATTRAAQSEQELAAERQKAAQSEQELAAERHKLAEKQREIDALKSTLSHANTELVRVGAQPLSVSNAGEVEVTAGTRAVLWGLGVASIIAVAFTVAVGVTSETNGILVAKIAVIFAAVWLAVWTRRRQTAGKILSRVIGWALIARLVIELFFETIWKAL